MSFLPDGLFMTFSHADKPELLAPAGGPESLRAAVANGADAVYLGLDTLNARRSAENFTLETLPEACRFAHLRGVRVYLTANIVLLPSEMQSALDLLAGAWAAGIDAVIVQDLGLLRALREALPQVRIHASTQMNTHTSATVRALAERGISRVTLSRETSIDEISTLTDAGRAVGVEVESFIHGALCMCYSGQCLLSSLIGGRSANRGLCAQPCRLSYELVDEADHVLATPGAHLLSPKDLAGIASLPALVETGVASLKIEGRMKSAEYVALVTGVYRAALDRARALPECFEVRAGERSVLEEAFSRGFTDAYLRGERGNDMMSYGRPNNRGVLVGRIGAVEQGRATIALDTALDAEDTIEVWTGRGRFAQPAGPLSYDGSQHAAAPGGRTVTISVKEPVSAGDRVFRVRNAALSAAAARTFENPMEAAPLELSFHVSLIEGRPLSVRVIDPIGREALASGPLVERARTKPVTAEEVIEHVGRLGNTPYHAGSWSVDLSPGVGVGFSSLHRVRRDALAAYEAHVLAEWERPAARPVRTPSAGTPAQRPRTPKLVASVADLDIAAACMAAGADECHVPSWAVPSGSAVPDGVVISLPRICHDAEADRCGAHASPRVLAGTLGSLRDSARAGARVEADWSLNAVNALAVAELAELGASLVWLSPELSAMQLAEVVSAAPVAVGTAVAGRQELMVTEHCILMAEGPCGERCDTCARRVTPKALRDRKGYRFPVVTDATGRSHIYNSVRLDLSHALPQLLESRLDALRLDLETETAEQAVVEVRRVRSAVELALRGKTPAKRDDVATTSGHYFRGVR